MTNYEIAIDKIADIVEGTIDHLDREDALDYLYEIKSIIRLVKECDTANWIDCKCSMCGYENHSMTNINYCPNCGMRLKTFKRETKFDF